MISANLPLALNNTITSLFEPQMKRSLRPWQIVFYHLINRNLEDTGNYEYFSFYKYLKNIHVVYCRAALDST